MSGIILGADFTDEVIMGFSLKKFVKKAVKATNPIRVTKNLAKATIKAIDPRTTINIAKSIAKNPKNIKRSIGKLAMLDPGINASVKIFKDLKKPASKPKAAAAYKATVAKAQAGDANARKQVATLKQLAVAEQQAPQVPDSEMERGAEEIVQQAHDTNPQVFEQTYAQAARAPTPPAAAAPAQSPYYPQPYAQPYSPYQAAPQPSYYQPTQRIPQPGDPDYFSDEDFDDAEEVDASEDYDESEYDDEMEGDTPKQRRNKHRGARKARKPQVQGETLLGGGIARALTSGKLDYRAMVRENAEGLDSMGFSFGDLVKSATSVVKKIAPTAIAVAKLTPYGAAIDTAMKIASPALQQGVNMLRGAQKGDPVATAKVQQVKKLAAAGSVQGKAALKTLQQAKTLNNAVVTEARKTVQQPAATLSVPSATPGQAPVQVVVMMPDSGAMRDVVSAAKNAGSRFFLPVSSSLYQQGLST